MRPSRSPGYRCRHTCLRTGQESECTSEIAIDIQRLGWVGRRRRTVYIHVRRASRNVVEGGNRHWPSFPTSFPLASSPPRLVPPHLPVRPEPERNESDLTRAEGRDGQDDEPAHNECNECAVHRHRGWYVQRFGEAERRPRISGRMRGVEKKQISLSLGIWGMAYGVWRRSGKLKT